jgi:hypothetical protein
VLFRTSAVCIGLCAAGLLGGAGAGLLRPDRLVLVLVLLLVNLLSFLIRGTDFVRIARIGRQIAISVGLALPVVLLAASFAFERRAYGPWATVLAAGFSLAMGLASSQIERLLLPRGGTWLSALQRASEAVLEATPEEAPVRALQTLRDDPRAKIGSPRIFLLDPPLSFEVDLAGYLLGRSATLPSELKQLVQREPGTSLRAEVVFASEVRVPSMRPIAEWFRREEIHWITAIRVAEEVEGLLVMPVGDRTEHTCLEELEAAAILGSKLALAIAAKATVARGLERQRKAEVRADHAKTEMDRADFILSTIDARNQHATRRLAKGMPVGQEDASAKLAHAALEKRVRLGSTCIVQYPVGGDPVSPLAHAHLAGPRSSKPFVVVDCTNAREHAMSAWQTAESSPLALADGGMLVLLDAHALPADIQDLIAEVLFERRPPWGGCAAVDVQMALTLHRQEQLGAMVPRMQARLLNVAVLRLPSLVERAADLRVIVADAVAKEGLRQKGEAVGITDAAAALLLDRQYAGDWTELRLVAQQLVARCVGNVVGVEDARAVLLATFGSAEPPLAKKRGGRGKLRVVPDRFT